MYLARGGQSDPQAVELKAQSDDETVAGIAGPVPFVGREVVTVRVRRRHAGYRADERVYTYVVRPPGHGEVVRARAEQRPVELTDAEDAQWQPERVVSSSVHRRSHHWC